MEIIMQFLETLSPWGNVCSIIGLGLSIWLMRRTGNIKKNIDEALKKNNKIINYIDKRDEILSGLEECASYLINEHSRHEQLPYLRKMDSCLADFAACYPYMTTDIEKNIDAVRRSCKSTYFSFISVINPLNDIISMLRMEAISYD